MRQILHAVLYPALAQFKVDLATVGLECNEGKYEVFVTETGQDSPLRPHVMKLSGVTATNGDWCPGIIVGGCPIGSDEYVRQHLDTRFDKI